MCPVDEMRVLVGQVVGERDTGLGFGLDLVPAGAPADIAGDQVASGFGVVALQKNKVSKLRVKTVKNFKKKKKPRQGFGLKKRVRKKLQNQ